MSPQIAERLWRAFHAIDIRQLAQQTQAPTLVLHVTGNKMVPFEEGRRLASLIPDARFVPLESRNHVLLEDDPAWPRFLAEVRDFLGTVTIERETADPQTAISSLTPREQEVLTLIARGLNTEFIEFSPRQEMDEVLTHIEKQMQAA